jgi:cobalt-zinc-cadmium efflux system outer membrane protein
MPSFNGARHSAPSCAALIASLVLAALSSPVAAEALTLPDALTRAVRHDPTAAASAARVQAAQANLRQASVKPNPRVGVELENFAGSGRMGLLDRSETTLYYEQTLERGGKRAARSEVASAEVTVAEARRTLGSLDLLAEVQAVWAEAQAAQALAPIARRRLEIATALERDVGRRVASARDPLFTGERARTGVAQAKIALDQAQDAARNARASLAAYWSGDTEFELDPSPFASAAKPTDLRTRDDTPDLTLIAAERDAAAARVRLERSRAVQDPTFRGGVRHFGEGKATALIVGASIPLGFNDTNQGAIARALAERNATEAELAAARIAQAREVSRLVARQTATASEIERIGKEVLPSAERAARLVRDGFNRGGGAFTYLEVVEAQRAVTDAQARRIELLRSFHLDQARLDRLLARHLPLIASTEAP